MAWGVKDTEVNVRGAIGGKGGGGGEGGEECCKYPVGE